MNPLDLPPNFSPRGPQAPASTPLPAPPSAGVENPAFQCDNDDVNGRGGSIDNRNALGDIDANTATLEAPAADIWRSLGNSRSTSTTTLSSTSPSTEDVPFGCSSDDHHYNLNKNNSRGAEENGSIATTPTDTLTTREVPNGFSSGGSSSSLNPMGVDENSLEDSGAHASSASSTTSPSTISSGSVRRRVTAKGEGKKELLLSVRDLKNLRQDVPYQRLGSHHGKQSESTEGHWHETASLHSRTGDEEHDDCLTADEMVVVERPILTEFDMEQTVEKAEKQKKTPLAWAKKRARKCECSGACVKSFFLSLFPFIGHLKGYSLKSDLPSDIIAGITVGVMHIPQGMAYGQLAALPPVFGLYASFFPVILYSFLGTSKHMSVGTFAVVSLMVGTVVEKGMASKGLVPREWNDTVLVNGSATFVLVDNSQELAAERVRFAMAVTFAAGCIQLLLGMFRLGFVTVYLSDPLISGFTTGSSVHVFTSQIKHVFGVETGKYSGALNLIYTYQDFFTNIPKTNAITLIASIVAIMVLVVVKDYVNGNPRLKPYLKMPIPIELIVVILGTVMSFLVELKAVYKVKIVGDVPVGIPAPELNQFVYLKDMISDAIAVAIVAFAVSVSMAKILAKKHDYEIDSNQELLAYGITNMVCSFFSSFVTSASLSRSLIQDNAGGRTQVAGLVSSGVVLVVLLVLGTYFKYLPNCILAAIIIVALKGMFQQFGELRRLWSISIIDFLVWLVSFVATVLLDVDLGLLVGIIFALLTVIFRHQRPHLTLLGQIPGTDLYKDIHVFSGAHELDHIKIFRFESALFFANSEFFKSSLYKHTADPSVLKKIKRKAEKALQRVQVVPRKSLVFPEVMSEVCDHTKENGSITDPSQEPASNVMGESAAGGIEAPTANLIPKTEGEDEEVTVIRLPTVTDVYFIIIDCTTMGYVDSMGVKVLQQVITELRVYDVQIFFAHCKAAVREMFEKTDFYKTSDKQCLFLTVHDAVRYAQRLLAIVGGEGDDGKNVPSLERIQEASPKGSMELAPPEGPADQQAPSSELDVRM